MKNQLDLFEEVGGEEFRMYHEENPHLYRAFEEFVLFKISNGSQRYSSKAIFEKIRYETPLWGKDLNFKINNSFTPLFPRVFVKKHPQHKDFFRFRGSKFDKVKL